MNEAQLKDIGLHKCARCGGPIFINQKYCLSCEMMNAWEVLRTK